MEQLAEALTNWNEREETARSANDKESRPPTNPYKKLMGQLYGWMHQLPVIGFNSGKYDLNAIKQFLIPYFISTSKTEEQEEEAKEQVDKEEENEGIGSIFVIKRNNTFMCLSTDQLKFLDMTNYIAPGFSYDKYLKAYGCEVTKGHFPYEYMDRLERLDDTALPSKEAFFSQLKNEGISDEDHVVGGASLISQCYHEKGVTTLRQNEYGEAARLCRSIVGYDANALYLWSLMQDMPMGWYTRRREENDFRPESAQLYGQMAAEWLTWESERTGRDIRHQINGREKRIGKLLVDGWCSETKTAYQYHGYFFHGHSCTRQEVNAVNGKPMAELLAETRKNTAYLRHFVKVVEWWECEWKEMRRDPVMKKCVDAAFPRRRHVRWTMTSQQILSDVRAGTVFSLIECDLCLPEALREHFAEMQPVFKNIRLTRDDLGPFMRRYAEEHNIMATPRRMLLGSYRGDKILLATPLLRWYMDHGLEETHVYQIVEYDPIPCFRRFGDAVSTTRREGDIHSHKAIIADTMKLLGNSGYGKTITNVDRHRDVNYCTEKAASLMVNDRRFRQLDVVVDDAYEIQMNKKTVTYTLPVHVGFFVLQYAKMRMLQFYYDFINRSALFFSTARWIQTPPIWPWPPSPSTPS